MSRVSAVASCEHCPWKAKHVADDPCEALEFLARTLTAHVADRHQEHFAAHAAGPWNVPAWTVTCNAK